MRQITETEATNVKRATLAAPLTYDATCTAILQAKRDADVKADALVLAAGIMPEVENLEGVADYARQALRLALSRAADASREVPIGLTGRQVAREDVGTGGASAASLSTTAGADAEYDPTDTDRIGAALTLCPPRVRATVTAALQALADETSDKRVTLAGALIRAEGVNRSCKRAREIQEACNAWMAHLDGMRDALTEDPTNRLTAPRMPSAPTMHAVDNGRPTSGAGYATGLVSSVAPEGELFSMVPVLAPHRHTVARAARVNLPTANRWVPTHTPRNHWTDEALALADEAATREAAREASMRNLSATTPLMAGPVVSVRPCPTGGTDVRVTTADGATVLYAATGLTAEDVTTVREAVATHGALTTVKDHAPTTGEAALAEYLAGAKRKGKVDKSRSRSRAAVTGATVTR